MIVSLAYGKQVEMSTEQYFSMSDNDIAFLTAYGTGTEVTNPFHGSVLAHGEARAFEDFEEECEEEYLEELLASDPNERVIDTEFMNLDDL